MGFLSEVHSRNELDNIKILLESRGIPIFVGNEESARNYSF